MCNDTLDHNSARPVEPDLPPEQDPIAVLTRIQDVLRDVVGATTYTICTFCAWAKEVFE